MLSLNCRNGQATSQSKAATSSERESQQSSRNSRAERETQLHAYLFLLRREIGDAVLVESDAAALRLHACSEQRAQGCLPPNKPQRREGSEVASYS